MRSIVDEFNATDGYEQGAAFFVRGWEQLSGTVGRPQEIINQAVLRDCDYLILILGRRWGTPPQLGEGYDSGTEEEFFEALALLADRDAPMRDVMILFKDSGAIDEGEDPQFERVRSFRDRLERGRQVLFNVFDTDLSFASFVRGALRGWSRDVGDKEAKVVELPEPTHAERPAPGTSVTRLLELATAKAAEGLAVQAERLFGAATADGDPDALIQFAKFMRRTGRYTRAIEMNELILTNPDVAQSSTPEDKLRRARALAGVGIVQRKLGEMGASRDALQEALVELDGIDDTEELAYVNDNLAHTLSQMGLTELADEAFARASQARIGAATSASQNSLVNEARAALRRGDRTRALELAEAASSDENDLPLRARALAVRARALFELRQYAEAEGLAKQCLDTNLAIKDDDGVGIAESLLARISLNLADLKSARLYAGASLERNLASGNLTGQATSYWTLAQIASREKDAPEVAELVDRAVALAAEAANIPLAEAIERWLARYSMSQGDAD